jgi:hypothetical protein
MDITPTWQSILYLLVAGIQKRAQDENAIASLRRLAEIGDDYSSRHPGTFEPGHWQRRVEELIVRLRGTKGRRGAAIEAAIKECDTLAEIGDKAVEESRS